MKLFPAIDLRNGQAVRLYQGITTRPRCTPPTPPPWRRISRPRGRNISMWWIWTGPRTAPWPISTPSAQYWKGAASLWRWAAASGTGNGCAAIWTEGGPGHPGHRRRQAIRRFWRRWWSGTGGRSWWGWMPGMEGGHPRMAGDHGGGQLPLLRDPPGPGGVHRDLHRHRPGRRTGRTNLDAYRRLSRIKGLDIVASGGITELSGASRWRTSGRRAPSWERRCTRGGSPSGMRWR